MRKRLKIVIVVFFLITIAFVSISAHALELKSRAFTNNGKIPVKYTGLSRNISPALFWDDVPEGTKSFVLIVDDPDAALRTWTHWVVYDIPSDVYRLRENIPFRGVLYNGMKQGKNSFHTFGYGGPYPPPGPPHRYVFTLYALDVFLNLPPGAYKHTVISAMKGHILAQTSITGIFGR